MPGSLLPLAIILVIIKASFKFPLMDGEERHNYWGGPFFCACMVVLKLGLIHRQTQMLTKSHKRRMLSPGLCVQMADSLFQFCFH